MNLLEAEWIPVRRLSGAQLMVAPWQVTEASADPIVALSSPRPDFDGALAQFLVGLLQTAFAPASESEWRRRFASPPKPEELREAFASFRLAFELFGDGPRFFQDLELSSADAEPKRIEKLLVAQHGTQDGNDHFVRLGAVKALCPACAATALMCLQINAPAGGPGHRVALRGGGPLTTLVWTEETLWEGLWLNVLPESEFCGDRGPGDRSDQQLVFPWLAATRTSEHERSTTYADVDPLQMYWSMPTRIRLGEPAESGSCDVCGAQGIEVVDSFGKKRHGINYEGEWPHPLTPRRGRLGEKYFVGGSRDGLAYRDWLGLIQTDGSRDQEPARVVQAFSGNGRGERMNRSFRVWAFGYAVDKAKASLWCEGTMPLFTVPEERRGFLEGEVAHLVYGAREVQSALRWSIKQALSDRPRDIKTVPSEIAYRFWQETEDGFYSRVRDLCDGEVDEAAARVVREGWHRETCRVAEQIFDDFAERLWFGSVDPGRLARAGNGLRAMVRGKKTMEAFRLVAPSAPKKGATKPASRTSPRTKETKTDG
jgi:CRISPR system Cascade subunit CasA